MSRALREFSGPEHRERTLVEERGQHSTDPYRTEQWGEEMVQVDPGPRRPDIERDKESLPAAVQQVEEEKGEQEQERV